MSEDISGNESSKTIKSASAAVPQIDAKHYVNSKNKDVSAVDVKPNARKTTVTATTSVIPSPSGSSIMEDKDATTTTVAIGNNTYTIGELISNMFKYISAAHFSARHKLFGRNSIDIN